MIAATIGAPTSAGSPALDPDTLYEVVNGERREIPHMGAWAGTIANVLAHCLITFAWPEKLGLTLIEVLFRLTPNGPARRPDLAFVTSERWPFLAPPTDDPPELPIVPNLAVEVISPTNIADEVDEKVVEYFNAGVELVWVIYPLRRRIYVYESAAQIRILTEKDELDGSKVLPGFRLKVADLFTLPVKR
jgi:Uma2 family endonuclease